MENARQLGAVTQPVDLDQLRTESRQLLALVDHLDKERKFLFDAVVLLGLLLEQTSVLDTVKRLMLHSHGDRVETKDMLVRLACLRRDLSEQQLPADLARLRRQCREILDRHGLTRAYTETITDDYTY